MLIDNIEQFKVLGPLQMPELIDPALLEETEYTDDYALLTFTLPKPYTIDELSDILEEQMELILMYHVVPSDATNFGQRCCAFSNPNFGHMFKLNMLTDDDAICNTIYVTIYDSLEFMGEDLRSELHRVSRAGRFAYQLPENELLLHFF